MPQGGARGQILGVIGIRTVRDSDRVYMPLNELLLVVLVCFHGKVYSEVHANIYRGQKFHSSALSYELNLERTSNSSQSTHPVGLVLWEESLEEFILHITPLCSLLYTLLNLKDKCTCFQDELKL